MTNRTSMFEELVRFVAMTALHRRPSPVLSLKSSIGLEEPAEAQLRGRLSGETSST